MVWFMIATLCAYFIKGLCGFANTLVFTSMLSFTSDNINISPMEVILGYPSNLILVIKERKQLQAKVWLPLTIMVVLGSIPGILLLKYTDVAIVKLIFGVVVILIEIDMLLRERSSTGNRKSKVLLLIIGIISGILCGLFGVGALLAAYVSRVTQNNSEFKANICAVFFVENTVRIILYTVAGIITFDTVRQVIWLIPFMLLGVIAGMKSSAILDEKKMKRVVLLLLIISGIAMIIRNI